jgi:hypothetical protein
VFEEYLEKKKIDPMNYIHPKKPMYSDICGPLASYLFLKKKTKGFAVLEKECGYSGMEYQILQKAREGELDGIKPDSKAAGQESYKFLKMFLAGEKLTEDSLKQSCKSAHPLCHFHLALSRIAAGKYDPADFSEFYKYYPLFEDIVNDFAARREQAIKAQKQKK